MSHGWYPGGVPVRQLVHIPSRRGNEGAGAAAPASFASACSEGVRTGAMGSRKGANVCAEGAVQPGDAGLDDRGQEVGERLPGDRGDVCGVQARGGDRDCWKEGGRGRGARGVQRRNCKGRRRQEEVARARWPDRPDRHLCRRGGLRGGVKTR